MRLEGVDKTKGVFAAAADRINKLARTVDATSARLARAGRVSSGAFSFRGFSATAHAVRNGLLGISAAAGAVGLAIQRASASLSVLGDRAAQAGTSADYLQRLELALGQMGAKGATVEAIADGMARMTKATGRAGEAGLKATLAEIAALETEGERVKALSETFGRSFGPGLAAIVRTGPQAVVDGLDKITNAMPGLSDDVVTKADAIADGFSSAGRALKNGWLESIVEIGDKLAGLTGMSSREFGIVFGAQLRFWLQAGLRYVSAFVEDAARVLGNFKTVFKIVFVDYLGGLLEEGLRKAGAKIVEWGEKIVARFKQVAGLVKALFTDDTVEDVNARTAAEIKAATEKYQKAYDEIGEKFAGNTVGELVRRLREEAGLKLSVDLSDLAAERDKAMEAAWGIDEKIEKSSTASLDKIGDAGVAAAKKTADAWKGASAVMAGSYEALKLSIKRTIAGAKGVAATVTTSLSGSPSAASSGDSPQLLQVQRDGWAFLRSSLSSLGVV